MDDEKELENRLVQILNDISCDPISYGSSKSSLFQFINSTSNAKTLFDLVGAVSFEVIQDNSKWNPYPRLLVDLIGNMIPDIVLRSKISAQNRIYIEVKKYQSLGHDEAASQIVRYFLHLLSTTQQKPKGNPNDIRRAVILAAPPAWFQSASNHKRWSDFLRTYTPLAKHFDITLAELHFGV